MPTGMQERFGAHVPVRWPSSYNRRRVTRLLPDITPYCIPPYPRSSSSLPIVALAFRVPREQDPMRLPVSMRPVLQARHYVQSAAHCQARAPHQAGRRGEEQGAEQGDHTDYGA
jgi:hypothetical protein